MIKLITENKPILLISPNSSSDIISQQILTLIAELMSGITNIDFESASSATVKRTTKLCQRGISRLMNLQGSVNIVSNDSMSAESLANDAIADLLNVLSQCVEVLKLRSVEGDEAMLDYAEVMLGLIELMASVLPTAEPPSEAGVVEPEFEQYL